MRNILFHSDLFGIIHCFDNFRNNRKLPVAITYLSHDAINGRMSVATTLPAGQPRPHITATKNNLKWTRKLFIQIAPNQVGAFLIEEVQFQEDLWQAHTF